MRAPDALMRSSAILTAREARGLTRRQYAAEKGLTTAEIWLLEKLEANLVFRFCILSVIHTLSKTEQNLPEVYQQIMALLQNDQRGG